MVLNILLIVYLPSITEYYNKISLLPVILGKLAVTKI